MQSDWQQLKEELLTDPVTRDAYNAMAPEYDIARSVIKERLRKKLTQKELADKCGMTQHMIAKLEGGEANPTLRTMSRVAEVLGKRVRLV